MNNSVVVMVVVAVAAFAMILPHQFLYSLSSCFSSLSVTITIPLTEDFVNYDNLIHY